MVYFNVMGAVGTSTRADACALQTNAQLPSALIANITVFLVHDALNFGPANNKTESITRKRKGPPKKPLKHKQQYRSRCLRAECDASPSTHRACSAPRHHHSCPLGPCRQWCLGFWACQQSKGTLQEEHRRQQIQPCTCRWRCQRPALRPPLRPLWEQTIHQKCCWRCLVGMVCG